MIFFLLISSSAFSQIWKDPNDTLTSFEKRPRLEKKHRNVKSYSISQFDSSGNEVQYDFREFNKEGILVKSFTGISRNQKVDTLYYDSIKPIEFSDDQIVGTIKKEYYENGKLWKVLTVKDEELTRRLTYYYPEPKVIAYSECHYFKIYDEPKTACDSTIGFKNKKGNLEKIESYFFKDSVPHITYYKYDRKGRILRIIYEESTGNYSTEYIRNRRGLLLRIEHKDELGRVYNYSVFEYNYR